MTYQNDGKHPDDSTVEVRYPRDKTQEVRGRELWPWMPGTVEQQCGPDEWLITIEDRSVAVQADGSPAQEGTPDEDLWFPQCFRDSSEIRQPVKEAGG